MKIQTITLFFGLLGFIGYSQPINPLFPDPHPPIEISGMKLVWADEFNLNGKPNPEFWNHEKGFVRNEELQCHQEIEK